MKTLGALRAIVRGGAIGFAIFMVFLVLAALFDAIEESVVGEMIWSFPVPMEFLEKVTTVLFGSHTDEGGIVVVLAAVGVEVTVAGSAIGFVIYSTREIMRQRR